MSLHISLLPTTIPDRQFFLPSLFFHVLATLCSLPSSFLPLLSLSLFFSLTLRIWYGASDSGWERGILREFCVYVLEIEIVCFQLLLFRWETPLAYRQKWNSHPWKEKWHNSWWHLLSAKSMKTSPWNEYSFDFSSYVSQRGSGKVVSVQFWDRMPFNRVWGQIWQK